MKILFWTDGFWPRMGGIETQGLTYVASIQKQGHQCLVIAQKDHHREKEEEIYSGIPIKRFDFKGIGAKKDLKKLRPIDAYLDWAIQEFKIDIVHLNTCIGWSAFVFSLFRKKFAAPIVLTVHAPFYEQSKTNPLIAKICSQVDRACCVSNWVLKQMEEQVAPSKLELIYNGLPLFEELPSPLNFSLPTFLLLGRFTKEKGFATAIQAFAFLKDSGSNARLLIAGKGEEEDSLKNLTQMLKLEDSVEFLGPLTRDQVPHAINRATSIIVPSSFESFGLTALEAMQMQRPVIASNVGGLPELVSDGKTGFLVPPNHPMELFKAMQTLLSQPERAVKMGIEGRQIMEKNFTLENHVAQYLNLYQTLILQKAL